MLLSSFPQSKFSRHPRPLKFLFPSEANTNKTTYSQVSQFKITHIFSVILALLEMEEEDINEQNTDIEEDDPVLNQIRYYILNIYFICAYS